MVAHQVRLPLGMLASIMSTGCPIPNPGPAAAPGKALRTVPVPHMGDPNGVSAPLATAWLIRQIFKIFRTKRFLKYLKQKEVDFLEQHK